jgi:hypothetical protein
VPPALVGPIPVGADQRNHLRYLGAAGHVIAGRALIALLSGVDSVPKEQVVWALEAISGMSYGDDGARWTVWWHDLPVEITTGRTGADELDATVDIAAGQSSVAAREYTSGTSRSTNHESA